MTLGFPTMIQKVKKIPKLQIQGHIQENIVITESGHNVFKVEATDAVVSLLVHVTLKPYQWTDNGHMLSTVNEFCKLHRYLIGKVMVTELSHDDYSMLLGKLEKYLPRSCMTYYPLKLMIKGIIKDRKIWVDGWPNVNCLVISEGKQKRISPRRGLAFCRSPEFVTSMHQSLKAVAEFLEEPIEICGLTKNITEAIRHSKSYEKSTDTLSDSYGTKLYSTDRNSLIKMTVPADITVSHLTSEYLDMVINSWKFSGSYEDANEYFKFLINDLLTICLFDINGKPIAWGLQQDHGCLGMVYVVPEYRRRGLGSLVISLLAEKMLEYDEFVYVTIEFDNKASFEMHEKLGFRDACKDMDFMWSLYTIN